LDKKKKELQTARREMIKQISRTEAWVNLLDLRDKLKRQGFSASVELLRSDLRILKDEMDDIEFLNLEDDIKTALWENFQQVQKDFDAAGSPAERRAASKIVSVLGKDILSVESSINTRRRSKQGSGGTGSAGGGPPVFQFGKVPVVKEEEDDDEDEEES